MQCSNCGRENISDAKFCVSCGTPLAQQDFSQNHNSAPVEPEIGATEVFEPVSAPVENPGNQSAESFTYDSVSASRFNDSYVPETLAERYHDVRPMKKSGKGIKITLIVLIIIAFLTLVGIILYFYTDLFGKDCKLCEKRFDSSGDYCSSCVEKYTCLECEEIDKNTKDGYCPDCIESHTCKVCDNVAETLEDDLCEECVEKYTCKNCDEVDVNAEDGYCRECSEKYICKDCNEFSENTENGVCDDCAVECLGCESRISGKTSYKDKDEFYYCEECDTGYYCDDCGAPKKNSSADCEYCIFCQECDTRIIPNSDFYVDKDNCYYCERCDTGYYCDDCGAPVENYSADCKYCD